MAQIPGSIPVTGKIAPTDTLDTFATHESQYGIGDKHVLDVAARDAITEQRRVWGMLCHLESGESYQLVKGAVDTDITNNANWQPFTLGSSLTVAAGSTAYLDITNDEISVSALLVTSVTTDAAADLATFVGASYTVGDEFQEGDVIILTTPSEVYIHNGGALGTTADFTVIDVPNLSDSYIRNLLSATGPLSYNPTTGDFTIAQATTSTDGYLSSTDWNTFNDKLSSVALNDNTDVTLTSVAQGDILYRNATEWVNLGAGTSGQVLQTNGAGANPSWETVATAVGNVGVIRDSDGGAETFYSDLQSAIDSCNTAGMNAVIKMYNDLTATTTINLDWTVGGNLNNRPDSITIDFNGFQLISNQADATNGITIDFDNSATYTHKVKLINGRVERLNGTSSNATIYSTGGGSLIMDTMFFWNDGTSATSYCGYLTNVSVETDNNGYNDLGGSIFRGAGKYGLRLANGKFQSFVGICDDTPTNGLNSWGVLTDAASAKNFYAYAENAEALSVTGSIATDFIAESGISIAVRVNNTNPNEICSNFVAKTTATTNQDYCIFMESGSVSHFHTFSSGSSKPNLHMGNNTIASHGTVINSVNSDSLFSGSNCELNFINFIVDGVGGTSIRDNCTFYHCHFLNKGGEAVRVVAQGSAGSKFTNNKFINCTFRSELNATNGYAYVYDGEASINSSTTDILIGCTFEVANTGSRCMIGVGSGVVNYTNSTFIGATAPLSNITQGITNTTDAQGNITI
jgi:hypothetical protein